ncbi:MAG: cytochrome c biogenesis protein CcsA [Verrucomicrobiota bacterium]
MENTALILSTLCFFGAFVVSLRGLRQESPFAPRFRLGLLAVGFLFQCAFLYLRGEQVRQCPITNGFEILIFVAWSTVCFYFLVGPAFRLSLLGFFTAPVACVLQLTALLFADRTVKPLVKEHDFWLELHASISLMAYGAFALACIAGVMFLIQDHLLRRGRLQALFYQLPPIHHLAQAIIRLLWIGFILLTGGMISAAMMARMPTAWKMGLIVIMWLAYGGLLGTRQLRGLGNKTIAVASVFAFLLPILTYFVISQRPGS